MDLLVFLCAFVTKPLGLKAIIHLHVASFSEGHKLKGGMKLVKRKKANEGKRNTKYFHSLEKRHFNSKTMRDLKTENNVRISKDAEILQEAKTYYEFLYSSKIDLSTSNKT